MKRLLLLVPFVFLAGCATDADLGNGRYGHLLKAETRSLFGVNDSRSRLFNCVRETDKNDYASYVYTDCQPMESEWRQSSSQGAGGMVVGGALIGVGAGVGGAVAEGGSAVSNALSSATSSSTSSAVSGGRGH